MPIVDITAIYPFNHGERATPGYEPEGAQFAVSSESKQVIVTIRGGGRWLEARADGIDASDELVDWVIEGERFINEYPEELAAEFDGIAASLLNAARTVGESIKYLLQRPDMPDNVVGLIEGFSLHLDGQVLQIPRPSIGYVKGHTRIALKGDLLTHFQNGLDLGYRPLVGMRHLFRAMQEVEPRFRWIDTTIALELSIKEALIRKRPEFEILLLEMPSPPLDKLYGSIMKGVFGESSPYVKNIKEGAATRNKLIHRPVGVEVNASEAQEYVHTAHRAINHLFALLYPDWPIAQQMKGLSFQG